jgi:hypothetical protein
MKSDLRIWLYSTPYSLKQPLSFPEGESHHTYRKCHLVKNMGAIKANGKTSKSKLVKKKL